MALWSVCTSSGVINNWNLNNYFSGDTGSIEYGAECEERPRRDSQSIDNGNNLYK